LFKVSVDMLHKTIRDLQQILQNKENGDFGQSFALTPKLYSKWRKHDR